VYYYDTEGKQRNYTIDFVVKYKDKPRLKAVEVKNNFHKNSEVTKIKHQAFMEECGSEMDHEFWLNDNIKDMGLNLKEIIISDRVILWG
jgi:hypothetical protein